MKVSRAIRAVLKPIAAVDRVATNMERDLYRAGDRAAHPIVAKKLDRCTISCEAELLGLADLPPIVVGQPGTESLQVSVLRLRVERPDGPAEVCVRQFVPTYLRRRIGPGAALAALAHETDRDTAVVDWNEMGNRAGGRLPVPKTLDQYAWPKRDGWPAVGRIEVRDQGRRERRLDERRASWTPVTARLRSAIPSFGGNRTEGREAWKLGLRLDDGRTIEAKVPMPDLASGRLCEFREGEKKLGGLVTTPEAVLRTDAPIHVLLDPAARTS